ncbi:efflux RND transporter periplasmic adaptor subunit [Aestuariibius sp. 2305UL40-4]|uniref:efflux RND transporter periplasmic adaptor subunit n=1 Tax=Aestuariibius violaceus TaxID=3234132 RepID=UPI00345E3796
MTTVIRTLMQGIFAAAILVSAWVYAFGVPDALRLGEIDQSAEIDSERSGRAPGGTRDRRQAETTVVAGPLSVEPYTDMLHAIGTGDALHSSTVISEVSGRVVEIHLTANTTVAVGEALVRLEARTEEIDVETAELALAEAQNTFARYESLRSSGNSVVTDVTLAEASTDMAIAEAELRQAQAELDERTIRAPISGRLGLSDVSVGDMLSTGDTVARVEDTAAILVVFELPERAIPLLAIEETVLASTPSLPGRVFEGLITTHDNRLDETTRSVTVEARIENTDGVFWPGMTFAIRVEHISDPFAVAPGTALIWNRTGPNIWAVQDDTVEAVPVTIRHRQGDLVWIEADVAAEDLIVVTEGAHKLRSGSRVAIVPSEPEDPAAPRVMSEPSEESSAVRPDLAERGASL